MFHVVFYVFNIKYCKVFLLLNQILPSWFAPVSTPVWESCGTGNRELGWELALTPEGWSLLASVTEQTRVRMFSEITSLFQSEGAKKTNIFFPTDHQLDNL